MEGSRPALAEEKQQRILAAGSRIVGDIGLAGIKYACDFNGYYGGSGRAPLLPLTAGKRPRSRAAGGNAN